MLLSVKMGEQDDSEYLYEQLAAALGEDIHSVQNMDSEERNHLLKGKISMKILHFYFCSI